MPHDDSGTSGPGNMPEIVVCMGSSCFARGNREHLRIIEAYLAEQGLQAEVRLSGSRCEERCADGPNLRINGVLYSGVDAGMVLDLLKRELAR